MNSKNRKTSVPHRLLINLSDQRNLKGNDKYVVLSNLSIYYKLKNIKKPYKNNKLKISGSTRSKNLNYLTDYNPYHIFKTFQLYHQKT